MIDPRIEEYVAAHTTPPPPWLERVERETRASLDSPQMLTGPVEGRLLELLVWASEAREVLEVGTYSGYGALAMAAGLADGGRVRTCEVDPDRAAFARRQIADSPYADRIEVLEGPALETIRGLDGPFDLVFIDADKTGYPDYYEELVPKLAPRGMMVLDNMLRSGTVLDPGDDEAARAIHGLNDRIARDERVVGVLLSVRDGVTIVRRADRPGA